jgi:hypothetical protein
MKRLSQSCIVQKLHLQVSSSSSSVPRYFVTLCDSKGFKRILLIPMCDDSTKSHEFSSVFMTCDKQSSRELSKNLLCLLILICILLITRDLFWACRIKFHFLRSPSVDEGAFSWISTFFALHFVTAVLWIGSRRHSTRHPTSFFYSFLVSWCLSLSSWLVILRLLGRCVRIICVLGAWTRLRIESRAWYLWWLLVSSTKKQTFPSKNSKLIKHSLPSKKLSWLPGRLTRFSH